MQQIYNDIRNNSRRKGPENWMNKESTTKGGKYSIKMARRGRETVLPRKMQQSNQWATTEWDHKGLDLSPNQQRIQAPHQESQPLILYGKDQTPKHLTQNCLLVFVVGGRREALRPWQRSWGRRLDIRKGGIKPQESPWKSSSIYPHNQSLPT